MPRSSFLFRTDPQVLEALRKWADDDLRSLNAQIDFLLRQSLKKAGRLKKEAEPEAPNDDEE